jgi:hypothetical protein
MPRRHVLSPYLFNSFLVLLVTVMSTIIFTVNVNAHSNLPTKLGVSSARRAVGVGERTELRIRLLDQAGNEIAATDDMNVTLIATRQKDIDAAKRDGKGQASFQRHGTLALPNGVQTVQTVVTIRKGYSVAALQFSSQQAGSVRIYAENENLVTGATLIAIVEKSGKRSPANREADAGIFRVASYQETFPPATRAASECWLEIEPTGEPKPELRDNKLQVRTFAVSLKSGGKYCRATKDIQVRLRSEKGGGNFSENFFTIPQGAFSYPLPNDDKLLELSTTNGADIEVSALPVVPANERPPVQAAPNVVFDFETTIRATKLQVRASQLKAMANGVESITLTIRPVDDGNRPVSNEDEGLEVRNVTLSAVNPTLGLRFENGATTIPIKKGDEFIATRVVSSYPLAGAKIKAEAKNIDGRPIEGVQEVEFCFPWTQLGGAMLGGLVFPLVFRVFGKQGEQLVPGGKTVVYAAGLVLGAMVFIAVFFGALGLTEFNFSGIPISIARFPTHNPLGACGIGFFGSVTLASAIALKDHRRVKVNAGESPTQA